MMGKFGALFAALRYGSSLTDPAIWKNRQNTINALIGLFGALLLLYPMEVSDDDIAAIAGGVAVLGGLVNAYLTTATSTKVGVGRDPAVRSDDSGGGPGLGDAGP